MKARLTQPPAQSSWIAVKTWQHVVRSPAFVGLFLAALIVLLAWPRLTGPPWQALWMPFTLRESEGNTLTWEQIHYFKVLGATLQSGAGLGDYNTDHYRSILPIYISSIFAWWLDSSYKGFALVDLLGWWLSAWTLYYLARRLAADRSSALVAAVLLTGSPLLVGFMWHQNLHVIQSASFVPCFLAGLLFLAGKRLTFGWRVLGIAAVLYVASLTYQYQWIIVPCLFSLVVVERPRWIWLLSITTATVIFVAMTFLTYQVLTSFGMSVSSLSNDPLTVVNSRLAAVIENGIPGIGYHFLEVLKLLIKSFHPYIVLLSAIGLIFARARLRILVCSGTVLGLASGYLHPVHWIAMSGYPFIYISAGLALVQGPRCLADFIARIGSGWFPRWGERITSVSRTLAYTSMVILILLAVWSTNTDLFGDYRFAQQWLGDSRW